LLDAQQLGMVGISDADQKFHPLIISIQSSEDGPGSALLLCVATKMVSISLAIPIRCLKDAAKALHYGASILQLIRTDCFAHQTRLPFQHGGGLCGSHGSLSRYLLSYKDEQMKKDASFWKTLLAFFHTFWFLSPHFIARLANSMDAIHEQESGPFRSHV
jgi:hypothetical protein